MTLCLFPGPGVFGICIMKISVHKCIYDYQMHQSSSLPTNKHNYFFYAIIFLFRNNNYKVYTAKNITSKVMSDS